MAKLTERSKDDVALRPFNVLSLCSGVGGLDLGLRMAVPQARTVCYVEREAYCVEVLATRMEEGWLDQAPVWSDLRTFAGGPWRGVVDCVTGGYPCQPFSYAGTRKGERDPRHLWPDIARVVRETGPQVCFFENVSGHLSLGFEAVADELQGMGYRVAAGLFTAEEVGASHKRERLFILTQLADSANGRRKAGTTPPEKESGPGEPSGNAGELPGGSGGRGRHVGNTQRPERGQGQLRKRRVEQGKHRDGEKAGESGSSIPLFPPGPSDSGWEEILRDYPWLRPSLADTHAARPLDEQQPKGRREAGTVAKRGKQVLLRPSTQAESVLCRMANGMAHRLDRLRATGNGVVPQTACHAFLTLLKSFAED